MCVQVSLKKKCVYKYFSIQFCPYNLDILKLNNIKLLMLGVNDLF